MSESEWNHFFAYHEFWSHVLPWMLFLVEPSTRHLLQPAWKAAQLLLWIRYSTGSEGYISNDFFRHSIDDSQTTYLTEVSGPSLNIFELLVIRNRPCKHSSKLQLSIRFTPSLDVRQDWYPMYYLKGMKARVSPVQSIEPHRIIDFHSDLNQEPPGP